MDSGALIRDGQHAIKNSLQLISSLIRQSLAEQSLPNLRTDGLDGLTNRLSIIAGVYHHLTLYGDTLAVRFDRYLEELLAETDWQEGCEVKITHANEDPPPLKLEDATALSFVVADCVRDLKTLGPDNLICMECEYVSTTKNRYFVIRMSREEGNDPSRIFTAKGGLFEEQFIQDLMEQAEAVAELSVNDAGKVQAVEIRVSNSAASLT
ncbi:MAG: histidine kinase dimerization/phosphoacceptor domain -containing protein [Pseudomonadota bacterium]